MATDWNNYYQKVLSNPTATEEAKTEARNRLGLNVDNQGGSTGSLQGTMTQDSNQQGTTGISNLSNLRLALRSALTEASQKKVASRIGMLSPMIQGGSSPDVIKSAIGLAQSGLRQTQEQIVSDVVSGYIEEQNLARQRFSDGLNYLKTLDSMGALSKTDDATLMGLSDQFGLDLNILMKARQASKENDDLAKAKALKDLSNTGSSNPINKPMTINEVNNFRLNYGFAPPPGLSWQQASDLMSLDTAPQWFIDQAQNETQQSFPMSILNNMWQEAKRKFNSYKKSSVSSSSNNGDIPKEWMQSTGDVTQY